MASNLISPCHFYPKFTSIAPTLNQYSTSIAFLHLLDDTIMLKIAHYLSFLITSSMGLNFIFCINQHTTQQYIIKMLDEGEKTDGFAAHFALESLKIFEATTSAINQSGLLSFFTINTIESCSLQLLCDEQVKAKQPTRL